VRAFQVSLQLRDVAQVVQRERIGRIIEVCPVKELCGLFELPALYGVNAFTIKALNGR
jgi:hypothetical protein